MRVPVQAGGSWNAGSPVEVVKTTFFGGTAVINQRTYDVSLDDRRFLVLKDEAVSAERTPSLVLVQNWFEELKRLVPVE